MSKRLKFYLLIGLQLVFLLGLIGSKIYTLKTGAKILLEVVPVDPRDIFRGEYARLNYKISNIDFTKAQAEKPNIDKGTVVYVTLKKGERFWDFADINTDWPEIKGTDRVVITGKVLRKNINISNNISNFRDLTVKGWLETNPHVIDQVKNLDSEYADWKQGDTIYIPFVQSSDKTWRPMYSNISKDINKMPKDSSLGTKLIIISAQVVHPDQTCSLSVEYGIESYYVPEGKAGGIERNSRTPGQEWVEVAVDKSGDSAICNIFIDGKPVSFQ